jgi:hypothetical protein
VVLKVVVDPLQSDVSLLLVMDGAGGSGFEVNVITLLVSDVPHAFDCVAEYEPAVVTSMLVPVAPVLHVIAAVGLVTYTCAVAPGQSGVEIFGAIIGAGGREPVVITIGLLAAE